MESKPTNLAAATFKGALWLYVSFFGGKLLVLVSTIVLARLLTQDDFGVMSFALTAMSILEIIGGFGVGQAVIYHQENPEAADTAFWLGLLIGIGTFLLTWVLAPLAGLYFQDERAVPAIKILAINFPITALGNVHNMLLAKRLSFGRRIFPELSKAVFKAIASIVLALLSFGSWSLVFGQIVGSIFSVIVLWWVMPWKPTLRFAKKAAKKLLVYGKDIVAVDVLSIIYSNTDYLLIGRFLGASALGVYSMAFRIPDLLIMQFCNIISQVTFPVFVIMQNDAEGLKKGFLNSLKYISLITFPLGLGMALTAEPMVRVLLSDKWIEAIPVIRAIAISSLFISLGYPTGILYKAQGKPYVLAAIELVDAAVQVPTLIGVVLIIKTIEAVAWAQVFVAFFAMMLDLLMATKLLKVPLKSMAKSFTPAVLCGLAMSLVVLSILFILGQAPFWLQLIAGVSAGGITYLGLLMILQRGIFLEAREIINKAFVRV